MRSFKVSSLSPLFAAAVATAGLAGCAAEATDDVLDQTQNVTGGSSAIESPVAFLFETAAKDAAPKCAGAMLADKFAVTAKACAKVGLIVGRAVDKDGRGARAKITKIHTPPDASADIVVVELDRALTGTHALITHMPLRTGYSVNAFAATEGKGLFAPGKNEASSVAASMIEESGTHGTLVPAKGTEICDGDVGAPVCSSVGGKIAGYNLYGTCGLSGLVVGRAAVAGAGAAEPPPAGAQPSTCSGGAWKVAQLGQHAAFLKTFAPEAFQPWFIDKPIVRNFPYYAPEGLWGYKTKGDVKTCTIETTSIGTIAPGGASARMTAKVSFAGMEKNAAAFGRFGYALKSEPTKMTWMPAKALSASKNATFDTHFEGIVTPANAGDYIVAFRASANGGESWTSCDTDGIDNGFSAEKALTLKVADASAPANPADPATPPATTPQDAPASDSSYSDPPAATGESASDPSGEDSSEPDDEPAAKKESQDSQGCSMSPSSPWSSSSTLPIAGLLLGLVALSRRRRAAAAR